jgi:hypothetical protein
MRNDAVAPTARNFNHGRDPLLDAEARQPLASGRTQNANEKCNHPAEGPPIGKNPERVRKNCWRRIDLDKYTVLGRSAVEMPCRSICSDPKPFRVKCSCSHATTRWWFLVCSC